MSLPSDVSLSNKGIEAHLLNRSAILHSPYTQKTNPIFSGLLTPPESPVRYAQWESLNGSPAQSPTSLTLDANTNLGSSKEAQRAMEALYVAIRNTKVEKFEHQDTSFTNKFTGSEAAPASMTSVDFSNANEIIYSIIEQAVEEKISDALSPLRLNINRLDDSLESMGSLQTHLRREHTDIRDQNDTMSRQLDLHYRTIEQNIEEFRSQSKTMNTMIETQTTMVNHLSQVVMNLPMAINQVVHTAVQQQTQLAIRDIMFAQQQAMFSVSDISGTRQSVSSDGSSSQCTCNHHDLEIRSTSSTQHSSSSISQSTCNASARSNGSFKYTLKKLFKPRK
ncbi:hypothetical protein TARUN_1222 [Trichoderma arundinaceum]|uniref:Uncharacterized protein n=1 Tax=Trichoderma arundinaceum TaxID=490622 RepID=A0A395NYR8_TRIAR|nr:hypothetical protein TARUN_1222 [Trichoderma arundinaceum]